MAFWSWSKTASSNSAADLTINWAEGQSPGSVNDSSRAMMARTAEYRDDIAGALVTGGTSTAYTVASNQVFNTLANMNGAMIAFTPHATNGATVTLNVDGLGAKPLRSSPAVELLAGTLILGTPYVATYSNADAAWYLHGFFGNPYNVPLGSGMDYWLPTAPNSSFVFPIGQAISRTTYSTLFAGMGTTHGVGDGSTTFNLPDKTGRVSAMKEASATRLTTAVGGVDGATMGSASSDQSKTLTLAQLPAAPPAGTVTFSLNTTGSNRIATSALPGANFNLDGSASHGGTPNSFPVGGTITLPNLGSGNAHPIVQPTIVCNYIIRIV